MRRGGEDYTAEWKIWHLSQQQITRWSRSKSGSSSYKYNGKQADVENNKQRRVLWSTSVGRRDCCRSMLCISPLNSSMTVLCLAHGHNRRKPGSRTCYSEPRPYLDACSAVFEQDVSGRNADFRQRHVLLYCASVSHKEKTKTFSQICS